jgi:ribosomal protein S18 acetylase RimI-like enzyme
MTLTLCRHTTPEAFLDRVGPLLLQREAENNLVFGIVGVLRDHPDYYSAPPYLASVEHGETPVACAIRTPPFGMILTRMPQDGLDLVAGDIEREYGEIPGVVAPAPTAEAFADVWSRRTGTEARVKMRQRIYQLDRVRPPEPPASGHLRQATEGDFDLLAEWIDAFSIEGEGTGPARYTGSSPHRKPQKTARLHLDNGSAFVWEDEEPVAMAVWSGPTPHGIRISGVYTPPEFRRRGYASALVADLSQRMLDDGRSFCSLYTDLANPTSNSIYQAIGYEPVCDSAMYEFLRSEG